MSPALATAAMTPAPEGMPAAAPAGGVATPSATPSEFVAVMDAVMSGTPPVVTTPPPASRAQEAPTLPLPTPAPAFTSDPPPSKPVRSKPTPRLNEREAWTHLVLPGPTLPTPVLPAEAAAVAAEPVTTSPVRLQDARSPSPTPERPAEAASRPERPATAAPPPLQAAAPTAAPPTQSPETTPTPAAPPPRSPETPGPRAAPSAVSFEAPTPLPADPVTRPPVVPVGADPVTRPPVVAAGADPEPTLVEVDTANDDEGGPTLRVLPSSAWRVSSAPLRLSDALFDAGLSPALDPLDVDTPPVRPDTPPVSTSYSPNNEDFPSKAPLSVDTPDLAVDTQSVDEVDTRGHGAGPGVRHPPAAAPSPIPLSDPGNPREVLSPPPLSQAGLGVAEVADEARPVTRRSSGHAEPAPGASTAPAPNPQVREVPTVGPGAEVSDENNEAGAGTSPLPESPITSSKGRTEASSVEVVVERAALPPEAPPTLPDTLAVQVDDPRGDWQIEVHRGNGLDLTIHAHDDIQALLRHAEPELRSRLAADGTPLGNLSFGAAGGSFGGSAHAGTDGHPTHPGASESPLPAAFPRPAPRASAFASAPPLRTRGLLDRSA